MRMPGLWLRRARRERKKKDPKLDHPGGVEAMRVGGIGASAVVDVMGGIDCESVDIGRVSPVPWPSVLIRLG